MSVQKCRRLPFVQSRLQALDLRLEAFGLADRLVTDSFADAVGDYLHPIYEHFESIVQYQIFDLNDL